jgi:beta-carotene 3-hydroxylase
MMNPILLKFVVVITTFIFMECVAWFAHKYLMHGALWILHTDHHKRDDKQFFEKNDYFFLIFATPAMICMYFGFSDFSIPFWIGIGITIYGMAYFLVHDIFIHQRFNLFRNTDSVYLRAIRRAHKMHHKHLGKHDGECFGMLWVPIKYFKEAAKSKYK